MYADKQYYRETFKGIPVEDDAELERLLMRASDHIDNVTNYRLKGVEFNTLADFFQEQVKKAVCAQVEYVTQSGGLDSFGSGDVTRVSVGQFSYQNGSSGSDMSNQALNYLKPTGLLYTGITTTQHVGYRHAYY